MSLFGWGAANHGQILIRAEEILYPQLIEDAKASRMGRLVGGGSHTILVCISIDIFFFGVNLTFHIRFMGN